MDLKEHLLQHLFSSVITCFSLDQTLLKLSLIDVKRPIVSRHQEESSSSSSSHDVSAAVRDVSENLRANIYCIFCKLGTRENRVCVNQSVSHILYCIALS